MGSIVTTSAALARPFHSLSRPMPTQFLVRPIALWIILLAGHSGGAGAQPTASTVEVLPFEYVDHIFVHAELNDGKNAVLLYDPIQNIMLDRRFVRQWCVPSYGGEDVGYGAPVHAGGAGAKQHVVHFVRDLELSLGSQQFAFPLTPVIPLDSMMASALGRHVDGLLGTNVLDAFVLEFDFEDMHFVLHDREAFDAPDDYAELPVTRMEDSQKPTIRATLTLPSGETLTGDYLLDFGMGGTLRLTTRYVDAHDLHERLSPTVATGAERGLGGALQSLVTRLPTFTLGDIALDDVTASLARESSGADADRAWDGLIGLGLLDRFHLYLNLQRDRLWMHPNQRYTAPFPYVQTGLRFAVPVSDDVGFRVVKVEDHSPAAEMGLQAGDQIVAIDGTALSSSNRRLWEDALHRSVGSTLQLTVQRKSERFEVALPVVDALRSQN